MQYISSTQNLRIKELIKLSASKKDRDLSGLFVIESIKLAIDAVLSGITIRTVFLSQTAIKKSGAELEQIIYASDETVEIPNELAEKISSAVTTQGIFCLCEQPKKPKLMPKNSGKYILLEHVQDPGNVGAIIRSAEGFGASGMFVTADCADVFSPKVLRSAMGGVFRLPIAVVEDISKTIAELRAAGINVYAAALDKGAKTVEQTDFSGGAAVVIGSEGQGLLPETISSCSGTVFIPITASTESLNAGVAASILLWEMCKK